MEIEDIGEWMQLADDDFDSAKLLNVAVRRHYEIICYLCAQATEKYLKAYLMYNDIIPEKTHNLRFLNDLCIELDREFQDISPLCDFVTRFASDVRYPHKYEVNEEDVNFSINAVEKICGIKPMLHIKNEINKAKNKEDDPAE
jgi:HEPN domain-containing protein